MPSNAVKPSNVILPAVLAPPDLPDPTRPIRPTRPRLAQHVMAPVSSMLVPPREMTCHDTEVGLVGQVGRVRFEGAPAATPSDGQAKRSEPSASTRGRGARLRQAYDGSAVARESGYERRLEGPNASEESACGHTEPRTSRSEARCQRQFALGVGPQRQ